MSDTERMEAVREALEGIRAAGNIELVYTSALPRTDKALAEVEAYERVVEAALWFARADEDAEALGEIGGYTEADEARYLGARQSLLDALAVVEAGR